MIRRLRTLSALRSDLTRVTRQRDSLAVQVGSLRGRVTVLEAEVAAAAPPFVVVVDGPAAVRDAQAGIDRMLGAIGGEPS